MIAAKTSGADIAKFNIGTQVTETCPWNNDGRLEIYGAVLNEKKLDY